MRIGIYNRYWNTFGGGENYIGTIAEVLSQDHEVELISIEFVDWGKLQSRLGLDLSRCTFRVWPNESCNVLSPLSAIYQLFINSTYSSSMIPRSERSVLICYFPHKLLFTKVGLKSAARRLIENLFRTRSLVSSLPQAGVISLISGFYEVEPDGRVWGADEVAIAVKEWPGVEVKIPLMPGSYVGIKSVNSDNSQLTWQVSDNVLHFTLLGEKRKATLITIISEPMAIKPFGNDDTRELGFCLDLSKNRLKTGTIIASSSGEHVPREALGLYSRVISISNFTSQWIERRWQLRSFKLSPPIDTDKFVPGDIQGKEKIILSVGRFFAGGHNKKHHEIVKAFVKMRATGIIQPDWRLVLIGAKHIDEQIHIDYFNKLCELSKGHPIDIIPDCPFDDLLKYYQRAMIYWHMAGWGENINFHPERFEHFGITICEAMACACVPVLFDGAAQREIVTTNQVNFLYNDFQTLVNHMEKLTKMDASQLAILGMRSRHEIGKYSRSTFDNRVRGAFDGLAYFKNDSRDKV